MNFKVWFSYIQNNPAVCVLFGLILQMGQTCTHLFGVLHLMPFLMQTWTEWGGFSVSSKEHYNKPTVEVGPRSESIGTGYSWNIGIFILELCLLSVYGSSRSFLSSVNMFYYVVRYNKSEWKRTL